MRITHIASVPFHAFPHRIAAGSGRTATHDVRIYKGRARGLPPGLDGLLLAGDLQGIDPRDGRLAGEALADEVARLAARGATPPPERLGVVLAGDLYSAPSADVRGASGDVRSVWRAFAARHRWVVGVRGNHDTFGAREEETAFRAEPRIHLLDGECIERDGLRLGGVGGIIGDPRKPARVDERAFVRAMRRVLDAAPAMLVLHQGPDANRGELRGHAAVRRALEASGELVAVCGHVYWPVPLAELRGGAQALNVDGRVVLLEPERDETGTDAVAGRDA